MCVVFTNLTADPTAFKSILSFHVEPSTFGFRHFSRALSHYLNAKPAIQQRINAFSSFHSLLPRLFTNSRKFSRASYEQILLFARERFFFNKATMIHQVHQRINHCILVQSKKSLPFERIREMRSTGHNTLEIREFVQTLTDVFEGF